MKKLLAILLVLCMVFSLVACGGKEDNGETPAPDDTTQSTQGSQDGGANGDGNDGGSQGGSQDGSQDGTQGTSTPAGSGSLGERTLNKSGAVSSVDKLANTYYKLTTEKKLNVAYFGGSVTGGTGGQNGYCWASETTKWLKSNFPNAQINELNNAWGGTSTLWGYFRMDEDSSGSKGNLVKFNPDLVFIEFSINDAYAHLTKMQSSYYMEGIVKKLRDANPKVDIVIVFVTDQSRQGKEHDNILGHKVVAEHYGIPTINVGNALVDELKKTGGKWEDYVTDIVHPNNKGYKVYADCIANYLKQTLVTSPDKSGYSAHAKPANDLVSNALQGSQVIPASTVTTHNGLKLINSGSVNCPDFGGKHLFGKNGNKITIEFEGRGISFLCDGGAGSTIIIKAGGETKVVNASGGNNFEYVGIENLAYGKYTAEIEIDLGTKVAFGGFLIEK